MRYFSGLILIPIILIQMKSNLTVSLVLIVSLFFGCNGQPTTNNEVTQLNNKVDSISYSLGFNVASSVKNQGLEEINVDVVAQAFQDVFAEGSTPLINDMQAKQILQTYFSSLQSSRADEQKKEGEGFLVENKDKPGITTLPSGLQYEVIVEGTGEKPTGTDRVKTHYHGTLINGTVFDRSVERGEPISFAVTGVIPGWTEALQLMSVGSKWRLFIPYNLAYGERGSGPVIPPFAALIFEVELLAIEN